MTRRSVDLSITPCSHARTWVAPFMHSEHKIDITSASRTRIAAIIDGGD